MLNALAEDFNQSVIVSTHPRTRKKINETGAIIDPRVKLLKPLGFSDYVHLQMHARATLSDSGTITEESSILNFPAPVTSETPMNAQKAWRRGAVMMTGMEYGRIVEALSILKDQPAGEVRSLRMVRDYDVGQCIAESCTYHLESCRLC